MKERSLSLCLKIRYWSSIVFYISILCYGGLVINLFSIQDIGTVVGVAIILLYIIALFCIMLKIETFMKYCDPLNRYNRKKYVAIQILELSEMLLASIFAQTHNEHKNVLGIFFAIFVTAASAFIAYIQKGIIETYEKTMNTASFDVIMTDYKQAVLYSKEVDIEGMMKAFLRFMLCIILLIFIYKYTLKSWIFTIVWIFLNIIVLWKLHWKGIKEFIHKKYSYFSIVCFVASLGIVLMKLIYDEVLPIKIFQGRDEQEYLMILVWFFLPLAFYGSKLSVIYTSLKYKWTK